jgi:hypothetical protein
MIASPLQIPRFIYDQPGDSGDEEGKEVGAKGAP